MGMKTLGEIENEVRRYGSAFAAIERARGTEKYFPATTVAAKQQSTLFASLAAWDGVVREALPALKQEYEGLKALRDAKDDYQARYNAFALISAESYQKYVDMPTFETGRINTTGLARLEYLRGILGERGNE